MINKILSVICVCFLCFAVGAMNDVNTRELPNSKIQQSGYEITEELMDRVENKNQCCKVPNVICGIMAFPFLALGLYAKNELQSAGYVIFVALLLLSVTR